jgi:hypothetical protein
LCFQNFICSLIFGEGIVAEMGFVPEKDKGKPLVYLVRPCTEMSASILAHISGQHTASADFHPHGPAV